MFGDINTKHNTKWNLKRLQQCGSAQYYASEFLQISLHTSWDDDVLISLFEDGLKPEIQEKLIWMDTPDTLNKFIEQVVKIDNKIYNFNARQRGNNFQRNPQMNNYQLNDRQPMQPHSDPYRLQSMELDAI